MKDLTKFGTSEWPLHPSGIKTILTCPWSSVMRFLHEPSDESGPAADTGSAMHVAVREMHRGQELADCIRIMHEEQGDYPRADLTEAAGLFLAYASDTRNSSASVIGTEIPIAFCIEPAAEDKTQAPIEVVGTVDQVRDADGMLHIYDVKTSKLDPMTLLHKHTTQVAAYAIGIAIKYNRPIGKCALILPRKYRAGDASNSPVFWHYSWSFKDIEQILKGVRHVIARIRNGDLWHTPNDGCMWCSARSPDVCLPKLQETLTILRSSS